VVSSRRSRILIAAVLGIGAAHGWCGTPSVSEHFADEPHDALVRKLGPGPGPGAAADPGTSLAFRQQRRWLPELRVLLLDGTVTNSGKAPATARDVRVATWTFRVADDQDGARYRPLAWRNDTWYGSTYWTGPGWTRVGKDWHHPGTHTPAVRRFTCLLYTSPSPRDVEESRMPSSA